jgi:hypothetical protein
VEGGVRSQSLCLYTNNSYILTRKWLKRLNLAFVVEFEPSSTDCPPKRRDSFAKMRLLQRLSNGDIGLTGKLRDDSVPRYAILSHTMGDESEEVTFNAMVRGTCRDKAGYEKNKFCSEQAARDGLQHSGWTVVVSTNQSRRSFRMPSHPCFVGTSAPQSATFTCPMSRIRRHRLHGNKHFGRADGSLAAGRFRSSSRRCRWNSSPKMPAD